MRGKKDLSHSDNYFQTRCWRKDENDNSVKLANDSMNEDTGLCKLTLHKLDLYACGSFACWFSGSVSEAELSVSILKGWHYAQIENEDTDIGGYRCDDSSLRQVGQNVDP